MKTPKLKDISADPAWPAWYARLRGPAGYRQWTKKLDTFLQAVQRHQLNRIQRNRRLHTEFAQSPHFTLYTMPISVEDFCCFAMKARAGQRRKVWLHAVAQKMVLDQRAASNIPAEVPVRFTAKEVVQRASSYENTGFNIMSREMHELLYCVHLIECWTMATRAKKAAGNRWKRAPKKNIKKPS